MGHDIIPVNLNYGFIFLSSGYRCEISVSLHPLNSYASLHPIHFCTRAYYRPGVSSEITELNI